MIFSKRSLEGELVIDHRASPGMPETFPVGFPAGPIAREGQLLEVPFFVCRHCQASVIVNPDRTRARGFCLKCDHYVCDECDAVRVITGECRDVERRIETLQNLIEKHGPSPLFALMP